MLAVGVEEAAIPPFGAFQPFPGEVHGAPVVGLEEVEAEGHGLVGLEEVVEEDEVPRALGHLLPLQEDVVVVHPVPGEAEARGLRLGDLALVVGELEVNPSGVQVKALP